jgi:hypothetical protein
MAGCATFTKSRKMCGIGFGGIKAVTVGAYDSQNTIIKTVTGVTELADVFGAGSLARLEVKNTATNYVENGTSGGDTRSTSVTGNLPVILAVPKGADLVNVKLVEEILKGEIVFFIEHNDGSIRACGSQLGAIAITADDQTGGSLTDLNGFTVTLNTMEPDFSRGYILTGDALTDYASALLAYV